MVASSSPRPAEIMPFAMLFPAMPAMMVRENTTRVKYSGGPKRRAKLASRPANRISEMLETKSAKHEAYSAMSSALRASPLRDIG